MSLFEERASKFANRERLKKNEPVIVTEPEKESVDAHALGRIVREKLLSSGDPSVIFTEEGKKDLLRKIFELVSETHPHLTRLQKSQLSEDILDDITGYGPIQELIEAPDVSDILVNRYDRIFYERDGKKYRSEIQFRDEKHLRNVIEKIVSTVGRRVDESSSIVDARLPDGSRINAVVPPIAIKGATLTIRRFNHHVDIDTLIKQGSITRDQVDVLRSFVRNRLNIIISGGTGTGKTTFLNILSQFIPKEERVIVIEDPSELNLERYLPDVVQMEARAANVEGKGEVTMQMLVANALRMRPDRIIVGECRRGEAFDMLQAMNTGHEGSLTTLHANSPQDALFRLENMVLMAGYNLPVNVIRSYVASAIHIVIQLGRLRNGYRVVTHITEVCGDGEKIYTVDLYRRENGRLLKVRDFSERIQRLLEEER